MSPERLKRSDRLKQQVSPVIFCATLPYGEVFLMTFCSIERVVMILIEDLTVVSQREIAPRIFEMVLKGEMVADMQLGQFVHLKVPDPFPSQRLTTIKKRQPLSIVWSMREQLSFQRW